MFSLNEQKNGLQEEKDQIVSILLSINAPRISAADRPSEATRSFVCLVDEGGDKFKAHIVLYLVESQERVIYSWDKSFGKAKRADVEEEALDFVENMGFMMDNMNLTKLTKPQREELLSELPIFDQIKKSVAVPALESVADLSEEIIEELEELEMSDVKTAVAPFRMPPPKPSDESMSLDLLDEEFHRDTGDLDEALNSVFDSIAPDVIETPPPPISARATVPSAPPVSPAPAAEKKPLSSLQAIVRLLAGF